MRTLLIFFSILSVHFCFGQDYQAEFSYFLRKSDTLQQRILLEKWEKDNPDNPELYISYFNHYLNKAKMEEKQSVTGSDTTTNFTREALLKMEEGIDRFPDRLDMRFGKIYALKQNGNWQEFTNEIVKTIRYSDINNNWWLWMNNEKISDGKQFLLSSIQNYQLDLFKTKNDDLLINMRTIANEILALYPDHIESLSNLSITYIVIGDYDKGIAYLLAADRINPKDPILLSNIAHAFNLKGDTAKAIKYYKKVIKYGEKDIGEYAKGQIKTMKNSK
jgi:tetratricopeptide (TPR) repeat protein